MSNAIEGPDGAWGEQPVREIIAYASITAFAAIDHLESLAVLMDEEYPTLFGCTLLGRAAVEAETKVIWLLDPTIDVKARVMRQIGLRVAAVEARVRQLRDGGAGEEDVDTKVRRVTDARARAEQLGLGSLVEVPSITAVVSEGLLSCDFDVGRSAYGWMSDIAHARPTSLLDSVVIEPGEEAPSGRPVPVADFFEIPAFLTLTAFVGMFDGIVEYMGWDREVWTAWKQHSLRTWLELRADAMERARSYSLS